MARATTVGWSVRAVAEPARFSPDDEARCESELKCDSYQLLVTNVGDHPSAGVITLTDELPLGLEPNGVISGHINAETAEEWACSQAKGLDEAWTVTCHFNESVPVGGYAPFLNLSLRSGDLPTSGSVSNHVDVAGGGQPESTERTISTPIGSQPTPFGIEDLALEPIAAGGSASVEAAAHPWELTATFGTPSKIGPPGAENRFSPVMNIKTVSTLLPTGFLGNPLAATSCSQTALRQETCPLASRVGAFAILAGGISEGEFFFTGNAGTKPTPEGGCCSAIYNIIPEGGYPAEFGFTYAHQTIFLYPNVVRVPSGIHEPAVYRLRVVAAGIPATLETDHASLTFFGDPGQVDESVSGSAFLTNPAVCSGPETSVGLELESWEEAGNSFAQEAPVYPHLTGCSALQFHASLGLQPTAEEVGGSSTSQTAADSPSGLNVDLQVPQTSGFEELATPPLKTATVQLPEGLVINPSAASGLEGCEPTGVNGINIGSENIGAKGQDLGDPEATELGEGHAGPGGNDSPYDDGYYHTAPGHCPAASTMGTVEATTPLLPETIKGQIFLGTPECAPCSSADAEGGKLLKLYLEINDPKTGTILKLPGSVSANATSGRLTATFAENPQLPFSDLKLHFKTGPRAALTSPQTCGTYSSNSSLEPWSAPETPTAVSNSSFEISSGPQGCGSPPNKPDFEAGTTFTQAGAYAPFVLKLSREDGTQRLKALNVTLPPGLTGKLAGVQECSAAAIVAAEGKGGKAEQASPSCPLASELGTVNVGAGSGPDPYYVQGHAYLAGPYKGAPLSMAIITPAVAGPFDLGTVVVRAALFVNPETAQITVKSDPIPQIVSGIPLDVRSVAVNISRNQFTLNPTSCDPQTLAASIVADASTAAVSNPFQVGGCSALAFKPKVAIQLKGGTRRTKNPALTATVTYPPGSGYANIARAQVTLPHSEFLEQSHIRTVCTRVQFDSGAGNGAGCPKASVYGFARAVTPLLDKPLEGPVYLRSSSHKLPDLVAALGGQINVDLDGRIDTGKGGGIRNTFELVPDAPVSKFTLSMQGGKKGLLVNSENICSKPQKALAHFVAQNGKVLNLHPTIANSCKGGKKGKKSSAKKKSSTKKGAH